MSAAAPIATSAPAPEAPRTLAEKIALASLLALVVLVPLVPVGASLGGFRISDAGTLLLPLCAAASYAFLRQLGISRLPALAIEAPFAAFLAIALIGVPFAQAKATAVLALARYALYLVLAIVAACVARRTQNRLLLLWALAGTATVTALLGIGQLLRNSPADRVFAIAGGPAVRAFATLVNPNFFAEYLLIAISATIALVLCQRRGLLRAAAFCCALLQAIALALTYTRGSWLALALGIATGVMLIDLRWLWAVAAGGAATLAVPALRERLASLASLSGSTGQRLTVWGHAVAVIEHFPIVGVGLGGYLKALERLTGRTVTDASGDILGAHNSYLQLTAETGVLGGLAFLSTAAAAIIAGVRYGIEKSGDWVARYVNAALTIGVVGFAANALVSNSFQHPQAAMMFWVLVGLQAANGETLRRLKVWQPITAGPLGRLLFGERQ